MRRIIDLHANDRVRADHHALPTLDTDIGVPYWQLQRNVAFFPGGRARRIRSIAGQGAHRQCVAFACNHRAKHLTDKGRRFSRYWWTPCQHGQRHSACVSILARQRSRLIIATRLGTCRNCLDGCRDAYLVEVGQGLIDRLEVLLHDSFPTLTVGLLNAVFDLGNRLLRR